jgi:hypothetical protein
MEMQGRIKIEGTAIVINEQKFWEAKFETEQGTVFKCFVKA